MQKLTPRLAERLHVADTRGIGKSLALAIVSLVLMTGVVYMFTMGLAGVTIGGVLSVWQIGTVERMLGISIDCLTVLLVNVVFNIMLLKVKR